MERNFILKFGALLFSIGLLLLSSCDGGGSNNSSNNPLTAGTGASSSNNQEVDTQQTDLFLSVFGPQYYERTTGKPLQETANFEVLDPALTYTLHIYSGGKDSLPNNSVTSAIVELNGETLLSPDDFKKHTPHIEKPVSLLAANTLKVELRGKPGSNMTIEILGPRLFAAVIDVMVTPQKDFNDVPSEYTGLAYGEATSPYIPNVTGQRVISQHIYATDVPLDYWTSVWVKYDLIPESSNREVLVDYGVFSSSDPNPSCPEGWRLATGGGALSADLTNQGNIWPATCANRFSSLCVHYAPMNEVDGFITNVGLSNNANPAPNCATWGEANGGYWPMQSDGVNIVHGCDEWRYVCYGKGKAWPTMPTSIEISDAEKLDLLHTYSPRVWFHNDEAFWPSSVDWAFPYQRRVQDGLERHWLFTIGPLATPSSVLPFFHGCNGASTAMPCTLDEAPVYAYWAKKRSSEYSFDYVDLVYFFYFPYNRGKEIAHTIWGNHVGDWEHLTVRLMWAYDDLNGWSLQPTQARLSAHDFGFTYEWDDIPKTDNTHPIIYSAKGSHGLWLEPGEHVYKVIVEGLVNLSDLTGEGTAWDTWNNLEAYNYNLEQGLAGSTWPLWMSTDFEDPGACDPTNPACGPIYRWGNFERGCEILGIDLGFCRLESGPTGPVSKNVWSDGPLK